MMKCLAGWCILLPSVSAWPWRSMVRIQRDMRSYRKRMATPLQITLRRRRLEDLISTSICTLILMVIYTKLLGLW